VADRGLSLTLSSLTVADLMAKSVGGATRGFHPDVVVCDDILWGTTGGELQRAADWFYGVLLPVLHHSSRLMMVGTPFSVQRFVR
jgi:hypothetical protein